MLDKSHEIVKNIQKKDAFHYSKYAIIIVVNILCVFLFVSINE